MERNDCGSVAFQDVWEFENREKVCFAIYLLRYRTSSPTLMFMPLSLRALNFDQTNANTGICTCLCIRNWSMGIMRV